LCDTLFSDSCNRAGRGCGRGGPGTWGWALYPLQEPLGPAAQAVNADPHLGEGSNVQDLHDEGVVLLPLKPRVGGGVKEGSWLWSETRLGAREEDRAFAQPLLLLATPHQPISYKLDMLLKD
jgi:hypothetical protein